MEEKDIEKSTSDYLLDIEKDLQKIKNNTKSCNEVKYNLVNESINQIKQFSSLTQHDSANLIKDIIEVLYNQSFKDILLKDRELSLRNSNFAYTLRVFLMTCTKEQLVYFNNALQIAYNEIDGGMKFYKTDYIHKNDKARAFIKLYKVFDHEKEYFNCSPKYIIEDKESFASFVAFWNEHSSRDLENTLQNIFDACEGIKNNVETLFTPKGQTQLFDFEKC